MKNERYKMYTVGVTAVLSAGIAIAVTTGNWYIPGILILIAVATMLLMKRKVTDVVEDERDRKVGGKAALMAMTIYSIAAAVVGTTLVAYGRHDATLFAVGNAILYGAAAYTCLYAILFKFYARKQDRD